MQKILDFLDGKKTIIGSIVLFLAGGSYALGWIDQATFEKITVFAGALTAFGLRMAIRKIK